LAFENAGIDDPDSERTRAFFKKLGKRDKYVWPPEAETQQQNRVQLHIDGLSTPRAIPALDGGALFFACYDKSCDKAGGPVNMSDVMDELKSQIGDNVSAAGGPIYDVMALRTVIEGLVLKRTQAAGLCMCRMSYGCVACGPIPLGTGGIVTGVQSISGGDGVVSVSATRVEPGSDLRLWNMRYHDPNSGQDGIQSIGSASFGGGSTKPPFGGKDYDVRLESTQ
jgi:hypothetical protein